VSDILEFPRRGRPDLALDGERWLEVLREARDAEPLGAVGPYVLLGEVGRGGQGIVYRARDTRAGTIVALKRLLVSERHPGSAHARLRNEVGAMRALSHEGVVRVLGVETDGPGLLIAMEWVEGETLSDWARGAGRDPRAVARLMAEICDVMHHAHARGVVHRDLKPSNVLVDAEAHPHVLDFGLAKLLSETQGAASASSPFLGTLAYAAPELIAHGPGAIDARSDLYSMGVMLHEMLTGRLPYELGGSISTAVTAILNATPVGLTDTAIDSRLRAILGRALAKKPDARYADARMMRDDLRGFADEAASGRPAEGAAAAHRRRRVLATAGALAVSAALLAVFMPTIVSRFAARPASGAAAVHAFLDETGATAIPPGSTRDAVRERLGEASKLAAARFADAPLDEAPVRIELAWRYSEIADWRGVTAEAGRAREILDSAGRTTDHGYAAVMTLLGNASIRTRRGDPIPMLQRAVAIERAQPVPDARILAEAHGGLATVYVDGGVGGFQEAEVQWGRTFDFFRSAPGGIGEVRAFLNYARMKMRVGESAAAVRAYERALEMMPDVPAMPSGEIADVQIELGDALKALGRGLDAEAAYLQSIEIRAGAIEQGAPTALSKYGTMRLEQGAAAEAISLFTTAIRTRLEVLALQYPAEPRNGEYARRLGARGFVPADIVPIGQLLREQAPAIVPLLRHTLLEIARAKSMLGLDADAAEIRRQIGVLDRLSPDVLPAR
jgi:tetratricopeptide (TPR) repeat protein/predicted Ser/Thr protein kinase